MVKMASQPVETQGLQQKSKRPSDSAFKQQRLPAWQPVLTAGTVLPTFFIIGILFIPVGVALLYFSDEVSEHVIDYTNCLQVGQSSLTCSEYLVTNPTGTTCKCKIDFQLEKDFVGNVYMYYGLSNYYQNHRRYVKSRDDDQLLGRLSSTPSTDCVPFAYDVIDVTGVEKPIAPCGAIANSLFNDTLTLNYGNASVPLLNTGIAWPSDKQIKFRNPEGDLKSILKDHYAKPKFWTKELWQLDEENPDNNGFQNEDLIVWMRTAALPSFRKLYRRIDHSKANFENGLKSGLYTLYINYQYPVSAFDGSKKMILSTTSLLGGKNPFLGIAYIVVGCICLILGIALLIIHIKCSKRKCVYRAGGWASAELGRKKQKQLPKWKKNVRKLRCNSGKEYTNQKGVTISAKTFIRNFDCGCKKKCSSQVNESDRELFFTSFWKLADYGKQNLFLRGLIKSSKTKVQRIRDGSRGSKNKSFTYSILVNGRNVQVCKVLFLKTLQIGWGRVYRCLKREKIFAVVDGRGKNEKNKIDDSAVIAHIKSFPAYQSHYSRKDNPERKYLDSHLNIRKMYDLYVEKSIADKLPPVKQKFFYKVFSTKFNLHFKPPKKDTCRICDELEMKIKFGDGGDSNLNLEKKLHLEKAQQARNSLKTELPSEQHYICTFDLQKALPFPKLSTSVAYYKRNMYVYNFGVHSMNTKTAYMHMWNETEGGRGSQEIAACLNKHLLTHASEYKYITMYSDACGGQNRNIKLSLSLLKLVGSTDLKVEIIDLKFMGSGHSFLPNDADFGVIENRSKKQQFIYSYNDWIEIVKSAKIKRPQYEVIEMERNEFLSTNILETNITNRKKTVDGHNFSWLNIKWLRFERNLPFSFKFKETLDKEVQFDEVYLGKTKKGKNLQSLQNLQQTILYPTRRAVTSEKKRDMIDLLKFIPPVYHSFYKNLPVKQEITTRQHQDQPQNDEDENDEFFYV